MQVLARDQAGVGGGTIARYPGGRVSEGGEGFGFGAAWIFGPAVLFAAAGHQARPNASFIGKARFDS